MITSFRHFTVIVCAMVLLFSNVFAQSGQTNTIATWLQTVEASHQAQTIQMLEPIELQTRSLPVDDGNFVTMDRDQLSSLFENQPALIEFDIPRGDNHVVTLKLARVNVTSDDFTVGTKGNDAQDNLVYKNGIHYRGIIAGDNNSVAALSFFNGEVMGFYNNDQGNYTIGKVDDEENVFAVYNAKELPLPTTGCFTADPGTAVQYDNDGNHNRGIGCKTVKVYFECDYKLYQDNGSNTTNVTNYVSGLFNQVATLYANENIDIQISQIYIWTSSDPYASLTTTSDVLNSFKATNGTSFNGNLAHFLTTRNLGGGIAYVDVLCTKSYAYGVSMIYNSYYNAPTYSWSVEVVTHELGHNLGSPHTQSCSWVGGALDNCYTTEGGCAAGPAPINGGTIMSYCHLNGTGINFNNGFGTQPGDLIRSRVLNASCITSSGTAPTGLATTGITTNSALLAWVAVAGATQYTVQYKAATSSTWLTAATTSAITYSLSGLSGNTSYNWQVKTDCSGYSAATTFTTTGSITCAAPVSLTSTNITSTSATVSWGTVSGASNYTVQYKTSAASMWNTLGTYTATTASITGLSASTTYNWQVKASCSTGYSLTSSFTTSASSGCIVPTGLTTTNIGSATAKLNWNTVSGATSYSIKYKKTTSSFWTNISNITTNYRVINNLTAGATYQWKVKSNCNSTFSPLSTFTTTTGGIGAMPGNEIITTINLYPNPVQSTVHLFIAGWESDVTGVAEIYNVTGSLIKWVSVKVDDNLIETNELPAGMYLVYVRKQATEPTVLRFVKD